VVSLNYFKAIKRLESDNFFLQILSQFEILDNLIQPYPEFQGIPTLMHPRVWEITIRYLKLFFLTKPFIETKKFQIPINTF